jgi:hypothetical protein
MASQVGIPVDKGLTWKRRLNLRTMFCQSIMMPVHAMRGGEAKVLFL